MNTCRKAGCRRASVPGTRHCYEHQTPRERLTTSPIASDDVKAWQPPPAPLSNGLASAAQFVYIVAVLTVLGALIGGIGLIAHSEPICGVNPYNVALTFCNGSDHPYRGVGTAVLIGGLVQAMLWFVLARVTQEVGKLRATRAAKLEAGG